MKKLFYILSWPIAARLAALGVFALGLIGSWLGAFAAEAMKKRGEPVSMEAEVVLCVIGGLGLIGVRLFAWLCCVFWVLFAFFSIIWNKWSDVDAVGILWAILWVALMLIPSIMMARGELLRRKPPNPVLRNACNRPDC